MKGDINQARVYRHFKSTQKVLDEEVPEWVKKARAKFTKGPKEKSLEWAIRSREVPAGSIIPTRKRSRRKKSR